MHYTETRWIHALFGGSTLAIVTLVGLAIAAETRRPVVLEQRIVPALHVIDRCEACHDPAEHSGRWLEEHPVEKFGCTPCHGGQGLATTKEGAHEPALDWERPLFTPPEREAACGKCHQGVPVPGAPLLTQGRIALRERGCAACHDIPGVPRPNLAPALDGLAAKVTPGWLRAWLKDPVGYDVHAQMPRFALDAGQIDALAAFLLAPAPPTATVADLRPLPQGIEGDSDRGRSAVGARRCATCHTFERPAGTFAINLALSGAKIDPKWLFNYLTDTHRLRPDTRMPGFRLPDAEAMDIVAYMTEQLVPDTETMPWAGADGPVKPELVAQGRKRFVELGCRGCHGLQGVPLQNNSVAFGAFGDRRADDMPHTSFIDRPVDLASWVVRKVGNPRAYDVPSARPSLMPTYRMDFRESLALGIALSAMTGKAPPTAYQRVAPEVTMPLPQGETGRLIERFRCMVCHRVGPQGGDVSRVPIDGAGSRLRGAWLEKFLREPTTLRMVQPERMPVLGLTEDEARLLAAWVDATLGDDRVGAAPVLQPGDIEAGKALYAKHDCASCHRAEAMKAPVLEEHPGRLEPAYVYALLRQGPVVVPERRHPETAVYPEAEARALTAYVLWLAESKVQAPVPAGETAAGGATGETGEAPAPAVAAP